MRYLVGGSSVGRHGLVHDCDVWFRCDGEVSESKREIQVTWARKRLTDAVDPVNARTSHVFVRPMDADTGIVRGHISPRIRGSSVRHQHETEAGVQVCTVCFSLLIRRRRMTKSWTMREGGLSLRRHAILALSLHAGR